MTVIYQSHFSRNQTLIRDFYGGGNYLAHRFTRHINKNEIRTVLEVGSRDAVDAIELSEYFHAHVYAFECNPQAIKICEQNTVNNPNVTLIPLACWDLTGEMPFYPVVGSKHDVLPTNIGASSCFKVTPDGVDAYNVQSEIVVLATRLDEWIKRADIDNIDLLCLDVQGATLRVLSGLGSYLSATKFIITEGYHLPGYEGEALAGEIGAFLKSSGFEYKGKVGEPPITDALFVRK